MPRRLGGGKGGEICNSEKSDVILREVEKEIRYEIREIQKQAKPIKVEDTEKRRKINLWKMKESQENYE